MTPPGCAGARAEFAGVVRPCPAAATGLEYARVSLAESYCTKAVMMSEQSISFEEVGDVTVAALRGCEITHQTGELLYARLRDLSDAGRPVKVAADLSRLTFLGSVGLTVMVVFLKRITSADGRFALAGLAGQCRNVMSVIRLDRVFDLYEDVLAGLGALQGSCGD